MTQTQDRVHHPIGMSVGPWLLKHCPGWPEALRTSYSPPASGDMTRGAKLHQHLHTRLHGGRIVYEPEGLDELAVENALEWLAEQMRTIRESGFSPVRTFGERKLRLLGRKGEELTYTYCDHGVLFGAGENELPIAALIVDWKFYMSSPRSAEIDLTQLGGMAAAMLQEFPTLRAVGAYAYYAYLDQEVKLSMRREQLEGVLEARFWRWFDARSSAELRSGPHCAQCRAQHTCPKSEATRQVLDISAPNGFGSLLRVDKESDSVEILDSGRTAKLLEWWKVAEARMAELKRLLAVALAQGGETEELALRSNGALRSFSDPEQAWDRIPEHVRSQLKPVVTPSSVEEALRRGGSSPAEAKKIVEETLGDLVRERPRRPSVTVKKEKGDA